MSKTSAGILMWRRGAGGIEVLLVHPGGPFFRKKDEGTWSIPKGEVEQGEELLAAAKRESDEELGFVPEGEFVALDPIRQKSGKVVHAFAVETDWDVASLKCNDFEMEWPPKSGKKARFPEVDRAEWFSLAEARVKINAAQAALLEELAQREKKTN